MPRSIRLFHLGYMAYAIAQEWQAGTASAVRHGASPEALALLQHPPVYTFGRRARYDHLLVQADELRDRGAEIIESDRGGDVTFHGPGQVVAYPILDLRGRHLGPNEYVRRLEETVIETLRRFEVAGERVVGRPGVWVGGSKIAALGVRVQGGVSTHGFALNVETDLSWFNAIVPCGISAAAVTSLQRVLGFSPGIVAVEDAMSDAFAGIFDSTLVPVSPSAVREPIPTHGR